MKSWYKMSKRKKFAQGSGVKEIQGISIEYDTVGKYHPGTMMRPPEYPELVIKRADIENEDEVIGWFIDTSDGRESYVMAQKQYMDMSDIFGKSSKIIIDNAGLRQTWIPEDDNSTLPDLKLEYIEVINEDDFTAIVDNAFREYLEENIMERTI